LGGFPRNTERAVITAKMEEIKGTVPGIVGTSVPGDYSNRGRLLFESNQKAWDMMKAMKGRKFQCQVNGQTVTLWHGFDKSKNEQLLSRRTIHVFTSLKAFFAANGMCNAMADFAWLKPNLLDLDGEVGVVYVKVAADPSHTKTTHDMTRRCEEGLQSRRVASQAVFEVIKVAKGEDIALKFVEAIECAVQEANAFTEMRDQD
jgi:hypothetical protein